MDAIAVAPKAAALASPKVVKNSKGAIVPSSQMAHVEFGCEHIREMLEAAKKPTLHNYRLILQSIHEKPSVLAQTHKSADGWPAVSFRPLYLCLQCPNVSPENDRDQHVETKLHCFSVESRNGHVYCGHCHDFIYDPELEMRRMQKGKKRKFEDTTTADEHKLIINNSTFLLPGNRPARAIQHGNFYLAEGHKKEDCGKEACVSCALDEMFVEFHSNEKTEGFGAVNMLQASWTAGEALAGYQQQDAHEYMQFMLNTLHLQNGGTSENDCSCIIHQTFYGKLSSTVTCDMCKNVTTALDPYMDLSLDVRNQPKKRKLDAGAHNSIEDTPLNLRDCLERFTGREKLGPEEYTCQNCQKEHPATKQLSIKRLPPVLPIHLKRFEHTKSTSAKIETKVSFPMKLDLYPYTTRHKFTQTKAYRAANPPVANHNMNTPANSLIYELASVIVHKGKMDSGHYVSYSREGSEWFMFDDSKVILVSEAEVLDAEAYLLFYMVNALEM